MFALIVFTLCSCAFIAFSHLWYLPLLSVLFHLYKYDKDVMQRLYLKRTCIVFFFAIVFRLIYGQFAENEILPYGIAASIYAYLAYSSWKYVHSIETYKSDDDKDDDTEDENNAQS